MSELPKDISDMEMSDDENLFDAEEADASSAHSGQPTITVMSEREGSISSSKSASRSVPIRIKLKLPNKAKSSSKGTDAEMESEEEDELEDDDEQDNDQVERSDEDDEDSDESEEIIAPPKTLTARQAALAGVPTGHLADISAAPSDSITKKKHLTDEELALRREENARKRKNQSEKRLADEKADTINRLLKKQSRKNRLNALTAAEDESASPHAGGSDAGNSNEATHKTPIPSYRWVSRTTTGPEGKTMQLSFSVPALAIPENLLDHSMPVDISIEGTTSRKERICMMPACSGPFKYRLVRDQRIIACGMAHLKALKDFDYEKGFTAQ